jgi:hypothetical protein
MATHVPAEIARTIPAAKGLATACGARHVTLVGKRMLQRNLPTSTWGVLNRLKRYELYNSNARNSTTQTPRTLRLKTPGTSRLRRRAPRDSKPQELYDSDASYITTQNPRNFTTQTPRTLRLKTPGTSRLRRLAPCNSKPQELYDSYTSYLTTQTLRTLRDKRYECYENTGSTT